MSFLFASINATAEAEPSAVNFRWQAADGAVYYDLYEKNDFIIRLSSDVLSYRKNNLQSDTEYSFSIAARDEENNTLDAAFIDVRTGSWDGLYEWINKTSKDNRGKMKNLMIRVETAVDSVFGQYHKLYMIMDDGSEVQIFPLYDFGDTSSGEWVNYKDTGRAGTSYRLNADRLNTSIFSPGKWRLDSVEIGYDSGSATVQSSAFGIVADTISSYRFFIEDGTMKLEYSTIGTGVADAILFRNPNPGEGDSFILTKIAE